MSLLIHYPAGATAFVGSASGSTTATLPAHVAGDYLLAFAFRAGSVTPPSLPIGWSNLGTIAEDGVGNEASARLAYRVATDDLTTSGTWTNATHTLFTAYRNTAGVTQLAAEHGVGDGVWTRTLYLQSEGGAWTAAFAGVASSDAGYEVSGYLDWVVRERRQNVSSPYDQAAAFDTNAVVEGMSYGVYSVTSKNPGGWCTVHVELAPGVSTLSFPSYHAVPRARRFARRPEGTPSATQTIRVLGDQLEDPSEVVVTPFVEGTLNTLSSAYAAAYAAIRAAERATSITTHEGTFLVRGITGYSLRVHGLGLLLTLRFAQRTAFVTDTPVDAVTWDGEAVTFDGEVVTYA